MKELQFYDVKSHTRFASRKYKIKRKNGRKYAIATAPSGIQAHRTC